MYLESEYSVAWFDEIYYFVSRFCGVFQIEPLLLFSFFRGGGD